VLRELMSLQRGMNFDLGNKGYSVIFDGSPGERALL
jgi:hypothetical protein